MNMLVQFNEAMAYIENNLLKMIEPHQISHIAGCSEYHFRRMFSFISGMPLGEYIRRRRLSLAGAMLQSEQIKIIDLALQLGYESPEAFSKAFYAMHGITPSQAKKAHAVLKTFCPLTFQLTIKGGTEMDYRIIEKESFYIVGFKKKITMQFKGVNAQMDEVVQKLTPEIITELKSLCNIEPKGMLSVSTEFEDRTEEGSELDQYIGVATAQPYDGCYDILPVAASTWAVFKAIGPFPNALQETWASIYAEWFPSSGFESTEGPELLWHESPDTSRPDYKSEIWIPVRRLKQ